MDARSDDDEDKPLDGGLVKGERVGQSFEVIVTVRDAVERIDAGLLVSTSDRGTASSDQGQLFEVIRTRSLYNKRNREKQEDGDEGYAENGVGAVEEVTGGELS